MTAGIYCDRIRIKRLKERGTNMKTVKLIEVGKLVARERRVKVNVRSDVPAAKVFILRRITGEEIRICK